MPERSGQRERMVEYDAAIRRRAAEVLAESIAAMQKPKFEPPPVDRKEAIRRKLLAEIEQMARSRCDD